jgi:hypothetical protein
VPPTDTDGVETIQGFTGDEIEVGGSIGGGIRVRNSSIRSSGSEGLINEGLLRDVLEGGSLGDVSTVEPVASTSVGGVSVGGPVASTSEWGVSVGRPAASTVLASNCNDDSNGSSSSSSSSRTYVRSSNSSNNDSARDDGIGGTFPPTYKDTHAQTDRNDLLYDQKQLQPQQQV